MKTIFILMISLSTMTLFSCSNQKSGTHTQGKDSAIVSVMDTTVVKHKVGGDKDEHGCKGSAGYQWSALKQECIRPFELKTKMKDLINSTLAGYLLFSTDNKQSEVFAAEFNPAIILNEDSKDVYVSADKKYKLEKDNQAHWFLSKTENGKTTSILQQD